MYIGIGECSIIKMILAATPTFTKSTHKRQDKTFTGQHRTKHNSVQNGYLKHVYIGNQPSNLVYWGFQDTVI